MLRCNRLLTNPRIPNRRHEAVHRRLVDHEVKAAVGEREGHHVALDPNHFWAVGVLGLHFGDQVGGEVEGGDGVVVGGEVGGECCGEGGREGGWALEGGQ